jgi:putative exosortase-associated protein (TIGR04073 family)
MSGENESVDGFSVLDVRMLDGQNEGWSRLWRVVSIVFLTVLMSILLSSSAAAENSPARKLGRGLANLSLGVMAIPGEIIETTRESGPTVGMTWGLIKGTGMMAVTEVIGLWEVMTCPFATPPDYTPILDPEFPWQRFTNREENRSARKVRTATAGGRRVRE